ncbi:Argininosuccinate lyase [Variovorax sp. PBS-H4]|uniref:Bug family tripartite tricarboxylate transporter substrate binding protein n=1 Tax=Variovorax sp. PBS-H4 TaxID=434008 RepID=UPI001316E07A|nr:tripartite tricarboxylate transporter substrate binding protein [Variovorax sp. PBS-H4]VTU34387.1 Argininosuccinate lyase [Variovorax sp. PBS-H4]
MQLTRRKATGAILLASVAPWLATSAGAQQFHPTKTVRIIVPYVPGGVPDLLARQIARELGVLWKQTVIVENRAGAAGAIGAENLARAPGDGFSFLVADDGALISAPLLKAKSSYDPENDIVPLGSVGASPYVILGAPESPPLQQLFGRAKAQPGSVDYATNGVGGPHHQMWERWQEQLGIKLNQVPYNGTLPALQDLAAGRVALMAATPSSALALLQAGRVNPLAAVSKTRFPFLPNVPTVGELGYGNLEGVAWYCFMAPGSMPTELREKIGADLRTVLRSPTYIAALEARHNIQLVLNGKEAAERMSRERAQAKAMFKRLSIEPT